MGRVPSSRETRSFSPASWLAKTAAGRSRREYGQGQDVFSQGDAADAVFYLERGSVRLIVVSARGREAVLGNLVQGAFFGESSLALQPLRLSTARALQSSTIVRVARRTMAALLRREPEFAKLFMAGLLSRNVRMEADLVTQLFNSSEKRLARVLLLLAGFGRKSQPRAVVPSPTEAALATRVGTTRARIGYFMKRFRRLGFIDYGGGALQVHAGLLGVLLRD